MIQSRVKSELKFMVVMCLSVCDQSSLRQDAECFLDAKFARGQAVPHVQGHYIGHQVNHIDGN